MLSSVIFAFVTISGIVILRGPNVSGPDSLFCISVVAFSLFIAHSICAKCYFFIILKRIHTHLLQSFYCKFCANILK